MDLCETQVTRGLITWTRNRGSGWHHPKMTQCIYVIVRTTLATGPKYSVFKLKFLIFSKFSMPDFLLAGILYWIYSLRLQSNLEDPRNVTLKYISFFVLWLIILYVILNHVLSATQLPEGREFWGITGSPLKSGCCDGVQLLWSIISNALEESE